MHVHNTLADTHNVLLGMNHAETCKVMNFTESNLYIKVTKPIMMASHHAQPPPLI